MLWAGIQERVINLHNPKQVEDVRKFLETFSLSYDGNVDYTVALYKGDVMVATGSLLGEVLRNIAVDEALQGEGLTAVVASHLLKEAARREIYHYFIFTKPDKAHLFSSLGFKEIATAEPYAALLESGVGSVTEYCREMKRQLQDLPDGHRAGLVVNCNPFTLGHKALIAKASAENEAAVVLVVSEEGSLFPFDIRFRLVCEGLREFKNIAVVPGGKYIVSAATFPGYFTRGEETVQAQTRLDAAVFGRHIAPALSITRRYVGDEPYCNVTRAYNEAMKEILPGCGVEVVQMPRIAAAGSIVSASRVREMIREDAWEEIRKLVPDTTFSYLVSPEAVPVIEKIKNSRSRH
jgi:[citrate (pro-3S)-lyase] ligase